MNVQKQQVKDVPGWVRSLYLFSQTKELWQNSIQIPYSLIKGDALSYLAYQSLGRRKYSDIDILIPRCNMKPFEKILISAGFRSTIDMNNQRNTRIFCVSQSHQIPPYIKGIQNQKIEIDINFDMFWGEYEGKRIDISEFLSDTIEIDIYGCKVKTLPPLKAMVQLILHHYKEMNSIYHLAGHNCINYEVENEDSQPRNPLTSHSRQTLK